MRERESKTTQLSAPPIDCLTAAFNREEASNTPARYSRANDEVKGGSMRSLTRLPAPIAIAILLIGVLTLVSPSVPAQARVTRNCTPGPGLDLAGCSYVNADLTGDNFSGSDLRRADFAGADLNETNFTNADLRHANLSGAGMVFDCNATPCPNDFNFPDFVFEVNPVFTGADLRGANLSSVTLGGIEFETQVCTLVHCVFITIIYPDAVLTGVKSGGIIGTPTSLPSGWALIDGYLTVPPPPLAITTPSTLPNATHDVPYSAQLAATGGNPPDRWSVASGALPRGLHLDPASGIISGTPRISGALVFSIQVRDTKTHQPTTQRAQTQSFILDVT